jgi:hypothetical protein
MTKPSPMGYLPRERSASQPSGYETGRIIQPIRLFFGHVPSPSTAQHSKAQEEENIQAQAMSATLINFFFFDPCDL